MVSTSYKSGLTREREIYQKLLYDPALEALRPFTVNFLGTLELKGEVDQSNPITANGVIAIKPIDEHKDEFSSRSQPQCLRLYTMTTTPTSLSRSLRHPISTFNLRRCRPWTPPCVPWASGRATRRAIICRPQG